MKFRWTGAGGLSIANIAAMRHGGVDEERIAAADAALRAKTKPSNEDDAPDDDEVDDAGARCPACGSSKDDDAETCSACGGRIDADDDDDDDDDESARDPKPRRAAAATDGHRFLTPSIAATSATIALEGEHPDARRLRRAGLDPRAAGYVSPEMVRAITRRRGAR